MSDIRKYIKDEKLDQLFNWNESRDYTCDVFGSVSGDISVPIPPNVQDLVRLHQIIRQRKCFTVLEFGVGYSTVVMADALRKNQEEWEKLDSSPAIRNRHMFQLFTVDASKEWMETTQERFPAALKDRVHFHFSEVKNGTFNDRLCHFYQSLPDIVPDFIYLDGPAPKDVQGEVNGMTFHCDERTVMSGDLLLMEPILLPGTFILLDGRTNNARFLKNNFQRDYEIIWDKEGDVTTFELNEERLGKYNLLGSDFLK